MDSPFLDLLKQIADGVVIYEPFRRDAQGMAEFQDTVHLRLEQLSRRFLVQDLNAKLDIRIERGGRAWRGYFPIGSELTSGQPDIKEGLYFGAELGPEHPSVKAGMPLHGANLFPSNIPQFRDAERWARDRGLTEIANDAETDNEVNIKAHKALGYAEEARVVCFRKDLRDLT